MDSQVAVFTDTYLPTVNGVSYTIDTWAQRWNKSYGRMDVVYPSAAYEPRAYEHPVPSLPFPYYEGYRASAPWIPSPVHNADLVHVHSLAVMGLMGYFLSSAKSCPLVASYHTPINEYSEYLVGDTSLTGPTRQLLRYQERVALGQTDHVVVPSADTKSYLRDVVGSRTPVSVISNGVDLTFFERVSSPAFQWCEGDRPVIGYTGRHGYEKELDLILRAVHQMDIEPKVVLSGDGPAREDLTALAAKLDVDAEFLGYLPRKRLPAFYSAVDVFAFPSPIETEGLVAMESIACGTPVVGADAGAIPETIRSGKSGYLFTPGDPDSFATEFRRALDAQASLSEDCLSIRSQFGLDRTLTELESLYTQLLEA